ncbi:hypothetical protein BH11PAT2_BH11PAT2_04980 [soil metagenome]
MILPMILMGCTPHSHVDTPAVVTAVRIIPDEQIGQMSIKGMPVPMYREGSKSVVIKLPDGRLLRISGDEAKNLHLNQHVIVTVDDCHAQTVRAK